MDKKVVLTGVKPTGVPHLGNYLGAIKPAIAMAKDENVDSFLFIADYHALTTVRDAKALKEDVYNVAATWLALGLDPKKTTIYKQSDIKEIFELNWILNCFCGKGLMNRAHAYKALVQENLDKEKGNNDPDHNINMGIYSYPVLMAADILMFNTDIVPVGKDQVQHVEIARDTANRFNHYYGEVIKPPGYEVQEDGEAIVGLDGRKMSKSYNNTIPAFSTEKKLKKTINKMVTDSTPPEEPKDPETSHIFDLFKLFASAQEQKDLADWYKRGIGWGEAKAELFKVVNRELAEPREKFEYLMNHKEEIDEILAAGAIFASKVASENLSRIRKACGIS